MELTKKDIEMLNDAVENGIIDLSCVLNELNDKKRKQLLAQHPYSIYQMDDGRWRTQIHDDTKKTKRRCITKTKLTDLEDAIIKSIKADQTKKEHEEISVNGLYPEWIKFKELEVVSTTIIRIDREFRTYYQNDPLMKKPIKDLKKIDLEVWLKTHIKEYEMTNRMYYNFSQILRDILNFALDKEIIENNPMDRIKINGRKLFRKVQKKNDETQVFTPDEVMAIEEMAWEDFKNETKRYILAPLAVIFQLQTGVRIGELVVLRYEDIVRERFIHVQRMYRKDKNKTVVNHAKTDAGDREVYLTDKALEIIDAAHQKQIELGVEDDGYIFSINGKPLGYAATEDLYRKYSLKIGDIVKSSHKARKTYISALQSANVNINTIRKMVGHVDERTTLNNYTFDRHIEAERNEMIEQALNAPQKVDAKIQKWMQ